MLDVDVVSVYKTRRNVAAVGGILCLAALVTNLMGIEWVADAVLLIAVVVALGQALGYAAEIAVAKIANSAGARASRVRDPVDLSDPPGT